MQIEIDWLQRPCSMILWSGGQLRSGRRGRSVSNSGRNLVPGTLSWFMDWFKGKFTESTIFTRKSMVSCRFPFNQSIDWLIFLRVLGRNWSISDGDWSILIRCVWILGYVYLFLSSCRYSHYIRHPKSLAVQCSRLVISATCTRLWAWEPDVRRPPPGSPLALWVFGCKNLCGPCAGRLAPWIASLSFIIMLVS